MKSEELIKRADAVKAAAAELGDDTEIIGCDLVYYRGKAMIHIRSGQNDHADEIERDEENHATRYYRHVSDSVELLWLILDDPLGVRNDTP